MKTYRMSQIGKILGPSVKGLEMYKFGLPYQSASGTFNDARSEGSVDLMLAAAEVYKEFIHPVSFMCDGTLVNRYVENAWFYQLRYGNADPEIVFTPEYSLADYDAKEIEEYNRYCLEITNQVPTLAEQKAIDWMLNKSYKPTE